MIKVDEAICGGCAICVAACPYGAMGIDGGVAAVDESLCHECGFCVEACPNGALELVPSEPETKVIPLNPQPVPVQPEDKIKDKVAGLWPALGAAATFAVTEVLPRALPVVLDALDRRSAANPTPTAPARGQGGWGGGRRRRGLGPRGWCGCTACGYKTAHRAGQPCAQVACPKCGGAMVRQ